MERAFTVSTRAILLALLGIVLFQAATRPVTISEAVLWGHLVRPPLRQAFVAPDAWTGLLYAVAAKRAIGIFRLSEYTLRLPAVIAGAVYLLVIARRARPLVAILLAIPPVALGWFSTATPYGIALALAVSGAGPWRISEIRRSLYCGLAVAVSPVFAVPLAGLAAWETLRHGVSIVERIVIPAVTAAFIVLIIPLSHAAVPSESAGKGGEEAAVRAAVRTLRNHGPLRISVAPPVLPLVEFYRARYRQGDWEINGRDPQYRIGADGTFEP